MRAIRLTRRDLSESAEPAATGPAAVAAAAEEATFFCTPRARADAMTELREISSVKIPKNAKVIEEARMEGDLRENAGYQYAKEEQKMLVQRQATLSDQLSRARVIGPDDVEVSRAGFGTRVLLLNLESNQEEDYTLLGRWEADPERHILSIQAPLAQQILGHKAGDSFTVDRPGGGSTQYELLKIENALRDGHWDAAGD
jgi:transcription elongation factor GreA